MKANSVIAGLLASAAASGAFAQACAPGANCSTSQTGGNSVGTQIIQDRDPKAIYQFGSKVGKVTVQPTMSGQIIFFPQIIWTNSADTSHQVQFQNLSLMCRTPSVISDAAIFADNELNVTCEIVTPR